MVGNPVCGDMMMITIKVRDDRIEDVKFKTFGRDVAEALDRLPPIKMHCSLLAEEAIKAAIEDYRDQAQKPKSWEE